MNTFISSLWSQDKIDVFLDKKKDMLSQSLYKVLYIYTDWYVLFVSLYSESCNLPLN